MAQRPIGGSGCADFFQKKRSDPLRASTVVWSKICPNRHITYFWTKNGQNALFVSQSCCLNGPMTHFNMDKKWTGNFSVQIRSIWTKKSLVQILSIELFCELLAPSWRQWWQITERSRLFVSLEHIQTTINFMTSILIDGIAFSGGKGPCERKTSLFSTRHHGARSQWPKYLNGLLLFERTASFIGSRMNMSMIWAALLALETCVLKEKRPSICRIVEGHFAWERECVTWLWRRQNYLDNNWTDFRRPTVVKAVKKWETDRQEWKASGVVRLDKFWTKRLGML